MTSKCRFCNELLKHIFVDLGETPLSNSFLTKEMLDQSEPFYPLRAFVCERCFLVQLSQYESPQKIFGDYAYFSSFSETWLKHAENYVSLILNKFGFDKNTLVVEIASNDGYLLQFFQKKGIPILGIEPAANVAKVAEKNGIPTIVKFFSTETANELVKTKKSADLIIGNNVLAHVPNLNDFVNGLKVLLKKTGIITLEFPHLMKLIQDVQFDTIYHEHFSYFSLHTVKNIFSSHNLIVFDVEEIPTHGGSLRIYLKHAENNSYPVSQSVMDLIKKEKLFGIEDISIYTNFMNKVKNLKENLREFFISTKNNGKTIICYGAAAKGNTLLNYCEIGMDFIDYIVDRNTHKQGLFLPGSHIPIKKPDEINKTKPDYIVILPWNIKEEIIQQLSYIRDWGGKFVVLVPQVKVIP